MNLRIVSLLILGLCALLLALSLGCSDPTSQTGPTGPASPTESGFGPGPTTSNLTVARDSASNRVASDEEEEFNCTNVERTAVRFSHPGYVDYDRVGLFVEFVGVPAGPVRLLVWWDYDNSPDEVQNIPLEDADVSGSEDRITIEKIIEHSYQGISRPTDLKVRVELVQDGLTGNCARNRRVVVTPQPSGGAAFPPPVGTVGTSGVLAGADWIVCRAHTSTAWFASQGAGGGNRYNAVTACQSLGYTGVDAWGGNCGTVCGFCGTSGLETYNGAGGPSPPTNFGSTVHWRCTK